jgi:Insertion element 4 transposase N-terminal
VPFELADAVLADACAVQRRLRLLPSRVGIYFVLAMCVPKSLIQVFPGPQAELPYH